MLADLEFLGFIALKSMLRGAAPLMELRRRVEAQIFSCRRPAALGEHASTAFIEDASGKRPPRSLPRVRP